MDGRDGMARACTLPPTHFGSTLRSFVRSARSNYPSFAPVSIESQDSLSLNGSLLQWKIGGRKRVAYRSLPNILVDRRYWGSRKAVAARRRYQGDLCVCVLWQAAGGWKRRKKTWTCVYKAMRTYREGGSQRRPIKCFFFFHSLLAAAQTASSSFSFLIYWWVGGVDV